MKQWDNPEKKAAPPILYSSQVYITMFVSQSLLLLTMNTVYGGGARMQDFIISVGIVFLLNLVSVIPSAILMKLYPGKSILEIAKTRMGRFAVIINGFYLFYFIIMASYYLSFFELFLSNVLDPKVSLILVSISVIGVSAYAAWQGIEAVVRVAELIACILVFGFVFLLLALLPKVESIEFLPFFENNFSSYMTGALLLFSRSDALSMFGILIPHTKGKKTTGFLVWNLAFYVLFTLVLIACVGTMGGYLDHWLFPVYSASAFAQTSLLQSMDALFVAMWICGLLIKLSMDLSFGSLCCRHISHRVKKWPIFPMAGIIGFLSLLICYFQNMQSIFFSLQLLFPVLLLGWIFIPVLLLILHFLVKNKAGKGEKPHEGTETSTKTTG